MRFPLLAAGVAGVVSLSAPTSLHAQVIRLEITSRHPAAEGRPAGSAGPYENIRGVVHGELDPADPHNAIIQDLALAPRNVRGRVEYAATFSLMAPVDRGRASGVLIYGVVNRGNGDAAPSPDGHISLVSGWQGDVEATGRNQTIEVPVARQADGGPVTGPVLARFVDLPDGAATAPIRIGSLGTAFYPPASTDTARATLRYHTGETIDGAVTGEAVVPPGDWAFADCDTRPFPGTPDPGRICVRGGFHAGRVYELTYVARDPLVLGIGLAATRDIVSFFRHADKDDAGTANPVAGLIRHAIATGTSQSGNFIRTFVHLGFNQDLDGRMVWDGIFPYIAARQTPMNFRFAAPGGAATLYEPGSEPVLWWSRYDDAVRGRGTGSLLDRCGATGTCPKVIEAFGASEFWGLRMSPDLVGTDAARDIPLPDNVRRYYMPGTTHGGGRGGFALAQPPPRQCTLSQNPNPMADTQRALTVALIEWVVRGTPPPASRYPTLAGGELVAPTAAAMGFPAIPDLALPGVNPVLDYDFGGTFDYPDMSGVIAGEPPRIRRVIPSRVPRVDRDGNEVGGVPSALHQAPLGTYLGWNVTASGVLEGQVCGFMGGYVPFAATRTERLARGDPRLSLEERYGTQEGYACVVRRAAEALVGDRFLLPDDAARIVTDAESAHLLPAGAGADASAAAIAGRLCR